MQSYQTKLDKLARQADREKKLREKREQFQDDSVPQKKRHPWRVNPACPKPRKTTQII